MKSKVFKNILFILLVTFNTVVLATDMSIQAKQLKSKNLPVEFNDDLDFKNMLLAIKRQKVAFMKNPLIGKLTISGKTYKLSKITKSLTKFEKLVKSYVKCEEQGKQTKADCRNDFNLNIKENFNFFEAISSSNKKPGAFFTGYYSPTLNSSHNRDGQYKYGVYKIPSGSRRKLTREQIIFEDRLENKNLNLFYTDDLFELYLLHVEGGGRVYLHENGKLTKKYISFNGYNSQKFNFISKYMLKKGYIKDGRIKTQRKFLKNNPQLWREIYSTCPGYIYFKFDKNEPAGLEDIPLTENRSMAQDKSVYKRKGLIAFVESQKPVREENDVIITEPFSRFFIDQDTGSAIKGQARADLYFGYGEQASFISENMEYGGRIIFLLLK